MYLDDLKVKSNGQNAWIIDLGFMIHSLKNFNIFVLVKIQTKMNKLKMQWLNSGEVQLCKSMK